MTAWEGVGAKAHRSGGRAFGLGSREIGYVHGDGLADIPFAVKARDEGIAAGLAERHRILPGSGWVSLWLREPDEVDEAPRPLRSYELALAQRTRRGKIESSQRASSRPRLFLDEHALVKVEPALTAVLPVALQQRPYLSPERLGSALTEADPAQLVNELLLL